MSNNRSNRRTEIRQTVLKGRRYDKNPVQRKEEFFETVDPEEIYNDKLFYKMKRACGRS
jgi:hypothetical protein